MVDTKLDGELNTGYGAKSGQLGIRPAPVTLSPSCASDRLKMKDFEDSVGFPHEHQNFIKQVRGEDVAE